MLLSQEAYVDAGNAYQHANTLLKGLHAQAIQIEAWCGLSFTSLRNDQLVEARDYAEKAWDGIKQNQFRGEWNWARSTFYLYAVLDALNDERSAQLLTMARSELMARAEKIEEPASRERFLNQIEPHRQIGELYAEIHIAA